MYRSIAGTDCFKSPEEVQKLQLAKSLKAYLEGRKFGWSDLSPGDAFEENPHRWSDVFDVHVDFPYDDVLIGGLRQEKESLHERIKRLCDRWRANPPTFDQQAFAEANQYKQQITAYRHLTGGNPDRYPFNNSMLNVIDWLVRTVPTVCPDEKDPIGVLERFVETCTFERPHTSSCTVTRGQKIAETACNAKGPRNPKASDNYDATVLSVYAPYCDAMFIDGGFRAIAMDGRIACEKRYGTKVFSEQVRDSLIAYIDELERCTPTEHFETMQFILGRKLQRNMGVTTS